MKRFYLLIFTMIGLILLVACSNDSNGDQTVIKYWSNYSDGEPNQKMLSAIIDDYEAENPDVKIEVEWMGRQVMSKVRNAMLSGEGPDLIDKTAPEIIGAI